MKQLLILPTCARDLLVSQSLIAAIKKRHADVELDVMVPSLLAPLATRFPEVNQVFNAPEPSQGLGLHWHVGRNLVALETHYQQAYIVPQSLKSALIPVAAQIPHRVGFRGPWRFGLLTDIRLPPKYKALADQYASLAYPHGQLPSAWQAPTLSLHIDTENQTHLIDQLDLAPYAEVSTRPLVILCPAGVQESSRQWPIAYFARLAAALIDQGCRIWILASYKEVQAAEQICAALSPSQQEFCDNLAGRTSWTDVVDLIACAQALVSNDSALAHISARLARPTWIPLGASDPEYAAPQGDQVHLLTYEALECQPCQRPRCQASTQLACLTHLQPESILESLLAQLKMQAPPVATAEAISA
ncbi:heptosyltransferase-2 [Allopseudospirillum japonicum]|uniref:lipopolysaccharide heptosyltransferase II n=1 Tax=Allopseudospirillum japonicum TaxID=64971 RepID=A0A1H6R9R5_9GAMM|nr:heptosyltransferase-2 [Allopseudospirillum japonicum]